MKPRKPKTFAAWLATSAPYELGLDRDIVNRVCRAMSNPECHAISSQQALLAHLQWLHVFYHDEDAWRRFALVARYLWMTFKGKAS
jgi:hypothetical protein